MYVSRNCFCFIFKEISYKRIFLEKFFLRTCKKKVTFFFLRNTILLLVNLRNSALLLVDRNWLWRHSVLCDLRNVKMAESLSFQLITSCTNTTISNIKGWICKQKNGRTMARQKSSVGKKSFAKAKPLSVPEKIEENETAENDNLSTRYLCYC